MKSLFDPNVFQDTVRRVETLQASAPRQWGKMTPAQMLEHTARVMEMACGKGRQKQIWPGKLLSWTFRGNFLGEKPFGKNAPTGRDFVIQNEPDFDAVKARLLLMMRELYAKGERGCDGNVHRFFGRLSGAEWGMTQYKHLDHHLRQFRCVRQRRGRRHRSNATRSNGGTEDLFYGSPTPGSPFSSRR